MSRLRSHNSRCAVCRSRLRVGKFELCLWEEDAWHWLVIECCGACRTAFRTMLSAVARPEVPQAPHLRLLGLSECPERVSPGEPASGAARTSRRSAGRVTAAIAVG